MTERTPTAEALEKARGMIHRKDGLGVTVLGFGSDEVHFVWTHAVRSTLALRATEEALVNVLALALEDFAAQAVKDFLERAIRGSERK